MKYKLNVVLNGTDTNPWHKLGLPQNPFPQIAEYAFTVGCLQIQKLGGNPIPNEEYIRETLKGFSKEFIDLCCANYEKGKMVIFNVEFEA